MRGRLRGFPGGTPRPAPISAGRGPVDNVRLPGEVRSQGATPVDDRQGVQVDPPSAFCPVGAGIARRRRAEARDAQCPTARGCDPVLQRRDIHCMPVMVVTRARRRRWQVQEAKARFSALLRAASTFGPQTITVRGRRSAVVLSPEDYDRLQQPRLSLAEFMARSPLVGVELDLERDRSLPGDGGL